MQQDMMAGVGTGEIPNPAAVQAFSLPEEMAAVSDFYCHSTRGVGADLYWCVDKLTMPVVPYTYQDGTSVSNVYRHTGRIIYEPKDWITNPVIEDGGTWIWFDEKLFRNEKKTHNRLFSRSFNNEYSNVGCEHLLIHNNNRLKAFLHLILPNRLARRIGKSILGTNVQASFSHHAQTCFEMGHIVAGVDGSHVDVVSIAEERQPKYSVSECKSILDFTIAHEIGHLLGLRHSGAVEPAGSLLSAPTNLVDTVVTQGELEAIWILGKTREIP